MNMDLGRDLQRLVIAVLLALVALAMVGLSADVRELETRVEMLEPADG